MWVEDRHYYLMLTKESREKREENENEEERKNKRENEIEGVSEGGREEESTLNIREILLTD